MILDELKYLIKDLEEILLKDKRFREDYLFKSQVRKIYEQEIKIQRLYFPYYNTSCPTIESTNKPEGTNINNSLNINNCINLLKPSDKYEEEELPEIESLIKLQQEGLNMTNQYSNRMKLSDLTQEERDILLPKLDIDNIRKLSREQLDKFLSIPRKYSNWKTLTSDEIKKIII